MNFPIRTFLGLRTGVSEPEPGSARVASNIKRNKVRGQLEPFDGLTLKWTVLPTVYYLSSFTPRKVESFYIPDDGGRAVYAVFGEYTRTTAGFSGTSVPTFGIFIRPYHDATGWHDAWLEVTEFAIVRLYSKGVGSISLDNSPTMTFPDDYFNGWSIVRLGDQTLTEDTGLLITDYVASTATLTVAAGDLALMTSLTNGTILHVHRGLYGRLFPNTSSSVTVRSLLDEFRLNSGGSTADTDAAIFYRDKTFFRNNNYVRKGTFGERGNFVVPTPAFGHGSLVPDGTNPDVGLPAGTYKLKTSLVTDDGQESELRDALDPSVTGALTLQNQSSGTGVQRLIDGKLGDYIYGLGASTAVGFKELYQIDKDTKEVVKTVLVSGESMTSLCTDGTYIYTVNLSDSLVSYRIQKYDSGLNLITNSPLRYVSASSFLQQSVISGGFILCVRVEAAAAYVEKWTTGQSYIANVQLTGTTVPNFITSDKTVGAYVWVSANSNYRVHRIAVSAMTESYHDITGVTSQPSAMSYYSTNVYVYCGSKIIKLDSSMAQTDWLSGGKLVSGTSYGMANNGTYLYVSIPTQYLVAYKLSDASEDAALAQASYAAEWLSTDGQTLYGCRNLNAASWAHSATGTIFNSLGVFSIKYKLYVSPGLTPIRSKYVRVYISKDDGPYYLVNSYSILQDSETNYIDFDTGTVWLAVPKHFYYRGQELTITKAEYEASTVGAITQIGRTVGDSGESRYTHAITANNRTYLVGRTISNKFQRNRVYLSAVSGDGVSEYDIFPNDVKYVLDVEYNDGDAVRALGNVADRILVLKDRSLVLLTPTTEGHNRDIVAKGVGIASVNSLVAWNEALYWLDHTGVQMFTTNGRENISESIQDQIFAFTDEQRAAAIATVDPKNKLYLLKINQTVFILDLEDLKKGRGEQWTTLDSTYDNYTLWMSVDTGSVPRRFITMSQSGLALYIPEEAKRIIGTYNIPFSWETERIELPSERGFDALVSALYIDYTSSVNLTISLYLDNATSPVKTWTAPSTGSGLLAPAPLAARAKHMRIGISGTVTADGQTIKIKRLGVYYNIIPAGGDQQVTAA